MKDQKHSQANAEKAHEVCKELENMQAERYNLDSHCEEIASRMLPDHKSLFNSYGNQTKGEKRNTEVFDSTAVIALERSGAIIDSLLTPRNSIWHRVSTNNPYLMKSRDVQAYFEEVNRALFRYRYAPKANFSAQNQQVYMSIMGYGTGTNFIDEMDGEPGIRYRNTHLSETFMAENHQGLIDKVVRRFRMTARQAIQKWGDILPERIREAAKNRPETEFTFIHRVCPRKNFDPERKDYRGMPFESCYVSVEGKAYLDEGGYTSFPYAIGRYRQVSGEVYGRSPAMAVLPAVKTLNEEKKMVLKQGHRSVDPVLLAHDDGVIDTFSLKPGAINFGGVDSQGRALVHALPVGNIAIGKELMDDERQVINDAFLITLFQVLVDAPNMTATEVMERAREKGILLAPSAGRLQDEYLGSMIDREIDCLARQMGSDGQPILPPMPPELLEAKGEYTVIYESPLSRMQKSEEVLGFQRTIEMAIGVANVTGDPSIFDHFEFDAALPEIADIQGAPLRWMKDPKKIQAIREGRAQAQQEQSEVDAAPAMAQMIGAAAKAKQVSNAK